MKSKGLKGVLIGVFLVCIIVGYYFYLSNKMEPEKTEKGTKVQEILAKDLEYTYPASPREVIKLYSQIIICFYKGEYSESELTKLGNQARSLFDTELLENKTEEQYFMDLKAEIEDYKKKKRTIIDYVIAPIDQVEYHIIDGENWAKVKVVYTLTEKSENKIRENLKYKNTYEEYLLREDSDKNWKIYGWHLVEPTELKAEAEESENEK